MNKRIKYIDSLKGLAIICVVMGHVTSGYIKASMFDNKWSFLWAVYMLVESFHMGLFFILSGYLYSFSYFESKVNNTKRLKIQIINILMNYILFSLLWCVFKILLSSYVNILISPFDVLLIPIKPIDHYWYLYVLIAFYIVFLMLSHYIKYTRLIISILLIFAMCIGFIPNIEIFSINRIIYFAFFFYFGISLEKEYINLGKKYILVLTIVSIMLICICWNETDLINNMPIINIIVALGISVFLLVVFQKVSLIGENNFLILCGKSCLEIYILHGYFTSGCRFLISKIRISNSLIATLIGVLLGVGMPMLISYICKKIHIYQFIFKPISILVKEK